MVLPEIVGGAVPECSVIQLVTTGDIMAVFVFHEVAFIVINEVFVKRVESPQAHVPHVGVGFDARMVAEGAVHEAEVVVACHDAVPCLTGRLEVADVLVAQLEVIIDIGDATVVASAATLGAVDEAVGEGLVAGTIEDDVVPQQAC